MRKERESCMVPFFTYINWCTVCGRQTPYKIVIGGLRIFSRRLQHCAQEDSFKNSNI